MRTECCECDKMAIGFWGRYPYCPQHLVAARREEPDAHRCPVCHQEQPSHVMWRGELCGRCKESNRFEDRLRNPYPGDWPKEDK
jgi:hypothetical protein